MYRVACIHYVLFSDVLIYCSYMLTNVAYVIGDTIILKKVKLVKNKYMKNVNETNFRIRCESTENIPKSVKRTSGETFYSSRFKRDLKVVQYEHDKSKSAQGRQHSGNSLTKTEHTSFPDILLLIKIIKK